MRIGGFQPFTLSDFPECLAAMAFTQGCNLRCPFCHNGGLIPTQAPNEKLVPEAYVLDFLQERQGKLDGLVVTGGEPTIQAHLTDFLHRVKALGYQVKLDTNGTRPEVLAALLEAGLVDYIAMDVKAPLEHYERLSGVPVPVRRLEESISLISLSGVRHEFRTTVVEPLLSREDLRAIRAMLPSDSAHRWQPFRAEHALDPALRDGSGAQKAHRPLTPAGVA